jgi:hypothetical protein
MRGRCAIAFHNQVAVSTMKIRLVEAVAPLLRTVKHR